MSRSNIRVASLHLYPLKSAAVVDVATASVEAEGLAGDRRMMVTDIGGECLTSRRFPSLLGIRCVFEGSEVVLLAPGKSPCVFDRRALSPAYETARVWGEQVTVLDAGDHVADWLSGYLDHPVRLAVKGPRTQRPLSLGDGGIVSFADTAPLLLIGEASLAELNAYIERPVEMARFRPNVVISGTLPFDEDGWAGIRIGEVEFQVAGPCDRCVVTTLDPQSGQSHEDREPLATLARRRRGEDGKPYFGQFLIPRGTGRISIGDRLEVLSRKQPVKLQMLPDMSRIVRARQSAPTRQSGPIPLVCTGIVREAADMATFRFRADDGGGLHYQPGQFITLLLEIDGEAIRRNYTISSSPSRPHHLSVTVKRVDDGRVSNWLHDNLRVGDRIAGLGPHGSFHLGAAEGSRKLLMLSAGSGITPMITMLRYIADLDMDLDIVFHHSARTAADIAFREELLLLQGQMRGRLFLSWNLTALGVVSEVEGKSWRLFRGRLDAAMLAETCPDISGRVTMCCGPSGFREAARRLHSELAPKAPYLEESFGTGAGDTPIAVIKPYKVVFRKSDVVTSGDNPSTLLDIARRSGVSIAADCEAGICGTCRCQVLSGEWGLAANCADPSRSVLTEDEKQAGFVLACSTRPVGDVIIDL